LEDKRLFIEKKLNNWRRRQSTEGKFWEASLAFDDEDHEDRWITKVKETFPYIKEGIRVYIGVGPTGSFHTRDLSMIGVDPLCRLFRTIFTKWYTPIIGIGEYIPIRDKSVDVVYSINMLDHCYDWRTVVDEIYRILKVGGKLFLHFDIHDRDSELHISIRSNLAIEYILPKFDGVLDVNREVIADKGKTKQSILGELIKR